MLFISRGMVRIRVGIRFSVWLVSGYAPVFMPLFVVTVTLLTVSIESIGEEAVNSESYKCVGSIIMASRRQEVVA